MSDLIKGMNRLNIRAAMGQIAREAGIKLARPGVEQCGQTTYCSPDRFFEEFGIKDRDCHNSVIEFAGRACYMSYDRRRPGGLHEYVDHIIETGHGSVLEHESFNWVSWGVSRTMTHELIRHRAGWAYSELSQRFVDMSEVRFVVPPAEEDNFDPSAFDKWCQQQRNALDQYEIDYTRYEARGLPRKEARQAARSSLPNCAETIIVCTANVRALRHLFVMRGDPAADAEIRRWACMVHDMFSWHSGFSDVVETDGKLTVQHRKV
jgi:thymidylate synthase (FAD)